MYVLKFGGSSVSSAASIRLVAEIIQTKSNNQQLIVVISALSGITDSLLAIVQSVTNNEPFKPRIQEMEDRHFEIIRELIPLNNQSAVISGIKQLFNELETIVEGCILVGEVSERSSDSILSFGERLSSYLIAHVLGIKQSDCQLIDSRELIKTTKKWGKTVVDFEQTNANLRNFFQANDAQITVAPGFIARSNDGTTTLLGRGGSDYSAAIIAAALDCDSLEIWTDVNGMYTCNPKQVKNAKTIAEMSYEEAMEMAYFGAKVLYPPTIQPVFEKRIPITIANTFDAHGGRTLIAHQENRVKSTPITGISTVNSIALLTLEGTGMIGVIGFSQRLVGALAKEQINVIFMTQASSEYSICIGVMEAEIVTAEITLLAEFKVEISEQLLLPPMVESSLSIIALVGDQLKNTKGISGRFFSALGQNNINVRAIAQGASERNISVVIAESDTSKALNVLHERFFEEQVKQLNLFVIGVGNVGEKFLEQLKDQYDYLKSTLKLQVNVVGLANSKQSLIDPEGIDLSNWKVALATMGESYLLPAFMKAIDHHNLRNSIVVDATASSEVANVYATLLTHRISVVTCNKIACSSSNEQFVNLNKISRNNAVSFLYETNVGAGLPIIDTLKNLVASGDRIHTIEAVLSGSLNFIFNEFNHTNTFQKAVQQAKNEGYTEPDPRLDLMGLDVIRKIIILIRECGYAMELDEVENEQFLPESCINATTVDDFFETLEHEQMHFQSLFEKAMAADCKLKYVAKFEIGKAKVGLKMIPKDHMFYQLEGKDNIVLFYTDRYADQPLLIKGAGAGAAVTASGIVADVIRVGRN